MYKSKKWGRVLEFGANFQSKCILVKISWLLTGSFFESLCVEIESWSLQKILINVSYCSRKNHSQYFFDELGWWNFWSVCSINGKFYVWGLHYRSFKTRRVIKFTTLLQIVFFALPNVTKPSRVTENNVSLIDPCLISNNQIFSANSYEFLFNTDHYMLTKETSIFCRQK